MVHIDLYSTILPKYHIMHLLDIYVEWQISLSLSLFDLVHILMKAVQIIDQNTNVRMLTS